MNERSTPAEPLRRSSPSRRVHALLQHWGEFEVYSGYESVSRYGRRRMMNRSIDSRAGTVLLKATANLSDDDLQAIVEVLNAAIRDAKGDEKDRRLLQEAADKYADADWKGFKPLDDHDAKGMP